MLVTLDSSHHESTLSRGRKHLSYVLGTSEYCSAKDWIC